MPYAVAGLTSFVQRYGPLISAMAERGLTRGQVRFRFLLLFPEESPALLDEAVSHLNPRFAQETAAPQISDAAMRAGIWLTLAQHLGLDPDPDHAALHLSTETVRDVTGLLAATDADGSVTRRTLSLIGAAMKHCAEDPATTFSAHDYERARLGLCTDARLLCSLAHYWPAPERTVSQRLGDGAWPVATDGMGFSAEGGESGHRAFTEEEYAAAVTAFLSHCRTTGRRPTTARYGRWAVAEGAGRTPRPFFDGVRRFFGSWEEAMRFASSRQPADEHSGEGFGDTRTWSDLATPEAQEMLGREGIGVVSATGGSSQGADESVWEDLRTLIATVLARLPWNDFLVVEYELRTRGPEAPAAWAGVGPHGVECAVVSAGQLSRADWPVDDTFFHEDEWHEPSAWDQPWTTGPHGFAEAAQKLVDGLRFGWGCSDPYRFHWGVGSFPAEPVDGSGAAVLAPDQRRWHPGPDDAGAGDL